MATRPINVTGGIRDAMDTINFGFGLLDDLTAYKPTNMAELERKNRELDKKLKEDYKRSKKILKRIRKQNRAMNRYVESFGNKVLGLVKSLNPVRLMSRLFGKEKEDDFGMQL